MPSLYIAVSHKTNTDDATCLIHPISMLNSPRNFSASISVMKAMAHLNMTVSNDISMPMAISFTSDIRKFQPLYQTYESGRWVTKHYEVFEPCRSQGSLSRLDICTGDEVNNLQYRPDIEVVFTYSLSRQDTYIFDNDRVLKAKMVSCDTTGSRASAETSPQGDDDEQYVTADPSTRA
ncbi:uncharacterized protein LOC144102271 [Amblyomma americanum]